MLPRKVEFIDAEDTHLVFVSAAPKHTLCLDTKGRIWYFGEKASVGIKHKEKY